MGDAVEVGVRMWTPKDIMDWPPPECERVQVCRVVGLGDTISVGALQMT